MKKILLLMLFATFGWQQLQAQCPAGTIWTSRTSAANNSWWSITYGNGVFVAIAFSGTGNRVMTSPDGITWTSRNAATDNDWYSVTYGNSLFVAVAFSGTGNRVMTSPDGITWTSRTSASDNRWSSVTYGNGLFVAVAAQPDPNGTARVMTSPNGITWTNRAAVNNYGWNSVTYGNGVFVAVGSIVTGYNVMTSLDGITWTGRTSTVFTNGKAITYGNGVFVAINGNQIATSLDGITWTNRTPATSNSFLSLTYGNGLFVAVPYGGTGKKVMTSPDGITWTAQNQAANNSWTAVTYGDGVFVAVSKDGLGNRVMTSSLRLVTPSVTIGANPGNSITTGTSVTFTATPTDGGTTPVYQWKKNGNNVGSDSVTYTDEALASDDIISCVLTSNDPCASPTTATSAGITMAVAASTTITKTGSLSAFTSCSGTASAEQGFTVSGANLTENIVITPPTGFELSTTSGSGFTSSLTLTQSGGSVAATAIYVRLSALASGTPSGDISCVSTGATSQIVAVSGTVNPTITPTFTQVAAIFSGASLSALPTTSNNAITGAWSPALNNTTTTTYTFTPASGQCATTATMTITVNPNVTTALPIFSYATPQNYTVGTAITALLPNNFGGAVPAGGSKSTTGPAASFSNPAGIVVDASGNVYVAEINNNRIRKISSAGVVSIFAGSENGDAGSTNGLGTAASFNNPYGLALDAAGNVYVADALNRKIRKITPEGLVSDFAGSGEEGSTNGTGTAASFQDIAGVAVDASGNVYVTDYGNRMIRKITSGGLVTTLAGSGSEGSIDGIGTEASFAFITGIAVDASGIVYVGDFSANNIRKITSEGVVTTLAGSGTPGSENGTGTAASFQNPLGLAVDAFGNVFVSDLGNHKIRKITPAGVVSDFAGSGTGSVENLMSPTGVAVDATGKVSVADHLTSDITLTIIPFGYSISPALPAGLTFDSSTGAISGTPTVASAATDYTVTATNETGSSSVVVNINVSAVNVTPTFAAVAPICSGGSLSALPTTSDNGITGTWSPALNNLATTLYTFTPTAGQNATTTTLTITVNPNVTPELTGNIQICAGESLADLPTTSNDGITGTWSPALDNTATKTYTFTPTAGQCALTTTLTIYVNSNVTPTFTEVGPICVGGSLDALPSTSEDCIPGTWSPALNNLATTTYTFLPSAGQCANIATLSITVNPIETPTFTAVAAICSGATLSALPLTSNNGVTGTWSPALDNMTTTTYTFTPDAGQCASTATLTINVTVSEPPTVGNPSTSYITVIITGECSHRTGVYIPIGLLNGKNNYAWGVDPSVKIGYDGAKWVLYENDDLNNVYFENTTVLPDLFPQTIGWSPVLCSGSLATYITYPTPTFCDGATIANLDATGTDLKWYDVDSGGTALAASTVLVSGNYFVTQTIAGCESARIPLSVIITPPLTPTFTEVDPICSGAALSALPLTSNNGITGTWLPALNNLATTTYTFTPDAGQQCAVPATMTITVNSCATPTFTPVSPICAGESLAALPNTSNNGITGTWSPSLDNTTTTTYTFTPDAGQYATTATLTINVTVIEPPIVGGATTSDIAVTITGKCSSLTGVFTFIGLLNGKNHYAWSVNPNLRMGYDGAKWVLYEYENEDLSNTGFESTTVLPGLFPPATGWSATLCEEGSLTYSFINANQTFCDGATIANLDATGTDLKWYNVASGGTALAASTVLVSGNYFVTQTIAGCESARALLSVIITPTTLTPTFSQVSAICSGASLSDLPTTSNDGITGTWLPALDNMATTIYTFTPDAGQCANPAVMTITVNHTTSPTADSQTFWGLTTVNQLLGNGTDLKWYIDANLGTALAFTEEVTTGTYYVSQTLNECESDRTAVAITVNKVIPNITTAPSASEITYGQNLYSSNLTGGAASVDGSFAFTNPETTPVAGTGSQNVTFTPTDTNHYDTVNFTVNVTVNKATPIIVTNPTASAILSGQTLASSTLTGGAANLSGGQIVASVLLVNSGATRLEVVSVVKDLTGLGLREAVNLVNAAPVVVKQDVSLEEALSIKLSLEQAGATVVIQSNSIDGTFAFTTPSIAPTVGLTAQSVTFTPTEIANYNIVTTFVDVMVNGHTAPPTASAQTHCIGATAANLLATGTDLKWYAVTTSGIALTSSTVLSSATYYVSQTLNGIESDRIGVTVTLNPLLKPTFKQIAAICSGTALAELPLTSLNGIEGTWSPAINNLATTTYTFTPNAGQCGKTTTMKIVVRDPGTTGTIAGGDVTVYAPGTALNSNGVSTLITNSTTLTLNGNSPGSIIQWQKSMNYVNATNATPAWSTVANVTAENNSVLINGKTLTVSNLTSTTWYRVQVSYGSCVTYANITKITVSPLAQTGVVTCLPSVCSGGSISFTSAAYTGNAIAWEVSTTSASAGFSTVAGENGLTYTMNNAPSTTFYVRSVVTSGTFSIARSAVKTITVNPISVAGTITGGGTFCSGSNKSLKIAGCKGAIQWMFSTDGTNFMNVPIGSAVAPTFSTTSTSSSASSYVVNNITGTTFFKAVVKSGLCSSAETNVVVFNTATTATATSLSVESAQVCSGSATSLYIPLNVGDLKFQKSNNWSSATPTWTTVNLKMTQTLYNGAYGVFSTGTLTQSTAYRVVSSIGNCAPVAYSDMAVIGIQVCAAVREIETSATITTPFEVIAYPNPSNNVFNFKVNGANDDEVSMIVFDMTGRQIENKVVKANDIENISLGQNYASGVYNVIVSQGVNTKTVRLVKK